ANFLQKEFSREQINDYLGGIGFVKLEKNKTQAISDDLNSLNQRIESICDNINTEFEQHQKVWLVLQLIEFIGDTGFVSVRKLELIQHIAREFNIADEEFSNGKDFILASVPEKIPLSQSVILVIGDDKADVELETIRYLYQPNLSGRVYFLHIASTNTLLVKYFGDSNLFLNSKTLKPGRAYIFGAGGVIRSPRVEPIYYSKIAGVFFQSWSKTNIRLTAENIEYRHIGSKNGVHQFTFDAHSGQFIAIMGGSGVGKSTLINLLNGNLKPLNGEIFINGYNLHKDKDDLKGIIGYVPQDDLLVEDLTVYQNLYFGARFCYSEKTDDQIIELVNETLKDFDLNEARNLKVGNPINKFISGGQRKRLNIAMELLREPAILFVDEPTSGLSSFDSERIILMLKRQTHKGKIVIANVHQPSSDIYKLFDKILVMDQGGRVVYQGNPMDAIVYFKHEGQFLKAEESECLCCGNVNTEQILRVLEARVVNEYGKLTRKRKRSASEWYELYIEKIQSRIIPKSHKDKLKLPINSFKVPNRWQQSILYFRRNLLSKLANKQFMLIALLEAPLLALVLGFFSKYTSGTLNNPNAYIYGNNDNIPSYLFMSVVAAIFMGLSISAEEIIRDQKVRKRESFLNLSYISYINSKVLTMIIFSAIQALLFTAVGNYILEVKGLFFSTWLILFSTAVCGNLIGLNISAALNSVISIYITIPLIIIPMLLLSGVVVNYNRLHRKILHPEFVPTVGDINPIRWAYEALCVHQFKSNKFNKHFFPLDQKISNNTYYASFLIPRLQIKLDEASKSITIGKVTRITNNDLRLVQNELNLLISDFVIEEIHHPDTSLLNLQSISVNDIITVKQFFSQLRIQLLDENQVLNRQKDLVYENLVNELGSNDAVYNLKRTYHNNALEDLVLGKNEIEKISTYNLRLIKKYNLGYSIPSARNGRSHMFAPSKRIGNEVISTLWFNVLVLWTMTITLYFSLLTNLLRTINKYLEIFKFRRLTKRIARYIPH
ncbi:MAG: ABC transporter, partial [Bacteroidetes bacterium HGW-Bacteroidetes-15]